ncbi:hypothetical protein HZH68_008931 [Vespula germanica]|uniref:Uncharacterized protein n=1 Tax=Vespula germanica TaxID=30212 RepID=A0A834K3A2_VESGE|nr:hypothetical protein HZH68_008931 [Vespula germanica]
MVYVSLKDLALDTQKFKSIRHCLDSIILSSGYASETQLYYEIHDCYFALKEYPYRSVTNVDVQSIRRRQTGLRAESLRSEGVRVEAGLDADEA